MSFLYILVAILVFGFLILIHEFGHYLTARLCGVTVNEFAIGMGPKLVWYQSKKTNITYSLRMLPIGGFVSMVGETEDDDKADSEGSLARKPAWKRLLVNAAGAIMNLLLGFLLMTILAMTMNLGSTQIAAFQPKEDATVFSADQGLSVKDTVLRVNGKRVHIADQLLYEIMHDGEKPVELTVLREDGKVVTLTVQFPTVEESGITFGDVDFLIYSEKKSFPTVVKHAFYKSVYVVQMVWESLIDLLSGKYSFQAVSGPVGTAGVISDAAKSGIASLAYITAVISVNLGIFNLLPLPALDGGHLLLILIEMVTRRRLPAKVGTIIDVTGLFLLLLLMAAVTFKDIFALF